MTLSRALAVRFTFILASLLLAFSPEPALSYSRVKDLVDVDGIRDNMLVGYGLVVGLNGPATV